MTRYLITAWCVRPFISFLDEVEACGVGQALIEHDHVWVEHRQLTARGSRRGQGQRAASRRLARIKPGCRR